MKDKLADFACSDSFWGVLKEFSRFFMENEMKTEKIDRKDEKKLNFSSNK